MPSVQKGNAQSLSHIGNRGPRRRSRTNRRPPWRVGFQATCAPSPSRGFEPAVCDFRPLRFEPRLASARRPPPRPAPGHERGAAAAPLPPPSPTPTTATTAAEGGDQQGAPKETLAWAAFEPAAFTRARAEHKLVLLDGAAEWCHWCHVMEATTYHDVRVQKLLDAHFVAAKVDVDSRPDIEQRYGDYGWPATVLFSADGKELGKYRGYIAPEAFAEILRTVVEAPKPGSAEASGAGGAPEGAAKGQLTEDEIAFAERFTALDLDEFYDETQGGWGRWQKAAVAMDNAWALSRAREGDTTAKEHVLFTLEKQRALIDPVWGGIYQYSAATDWDHPHFEKLMTFQSGALTNYSEAYALTHDTKWLEVAKAMRGYLDHFMTSPAGGFYATQDADLNAHEMGKRFMTGHEYYAKSDAERRALGIPRVDTHEYGMENGLAIAAYVSFSEASGDKTALASAERAAKRLLATHGVAAGAGGITHDAGEKGTSLHLSDNAAFGLALMRLYEATKNGEYAETPPPRLETPSFAISRTRTRGGSSPRAPIPTRSGSSR